MSISQFTICCVFHSKLNLIRSLYKKYICVIYLCVYHSNIDLQDLLLGLKIRINVGCHHHISSWKSATWPLRQAANINCVIMNLFWDIFKYPNFKMHLWNVLMLLAMQVNIFVHQINTCAMYMCKCFINLCPDSENMHISKHYFSVEGNSLVSHFREDWTLSHDIISFHLSLITHADMIVPKKTQFVLISMVKF